ncbi:hypothetical protein BIW11_13382 [Tropilaelaps mercedesae]|uniref:PCNA-interacting partner n=1 Tax=Tropilaelaps mercedesae TaxID=418985 RepID=A0A1V9X2P6_9ACAR|nr:hypothetical protein BIW11_13382 [Tropilaelaps mercedesae]
MEVILFEDYRATYADAVRRLLPASVLVLRAESFEDAASPTIAEFLIGLARKHSLLTSWQTTFLSHQEFFESLKVVCARLNQEAYGDFSVPTSDVISAHIDYSHGEVNPSTSAYRAFLKECNAMDQFGLLRLLEEHRTVLEDSLKVPLVIEGTLRTAWHKDVVAFLARDKALKRVEVELPVDGAVGEVLASQVHFEDVDVLLPKDVPTPNHSHLLAYTLTILKSFLSLLVNNRDEVAISCALSCPLVNLSHEAFTVIKRAAFDSKAPIYQFVQSYVMKKKLGGRGYAPRAGCPILAYVKEITAFIDMMDQLQTFIEEYAANVAVDKVIGCLLTRLSKASQQDRYKRSIMNKAKDIVKSLLERVDKADIADSNAIPGIIGRDAIQRIRTLTDYLSGLGYYEKAAKILCSPFSAATPNRTPVGAQTLFKLFRSPEELEDGEAVPSSERAPLLSSPQPKPTMVFNVGYEPKPPRRFTDNLSELANKVQSFGTKTCEPDRPPRPKLIIRKDNSETPSLKRSEKRKESPKKGRPKKKLKLVSADDPENQIHQPESKPKSTTKTKNAKNSIAPNQRTLNAFFRKI